jgi:hypothetical protein
MAVFSALRAGKAAGGAFEEPDVEATGCGVGIVVAEA